MSTSGTTDSGRSRTSPGLGLTILVVDRSPYVGDVLVSALEQEGCAAVVAREPAAVISLGRTLEPDLITIDLGEAVDADCMAQLLADPRLCGTPIILIVESARSVPPVLAAHAVRVFEKPFYLSDVVAATLQTLGRVAHP